MLVDFHLSIYQHTFKKNLNCENAIQRFFRISCAIRTYLCSFYCNRDPFLTCFLTVHMKRCVWAIYENHFGWRLIYLSSAKYGTIYTLYVFFCLRSNESLWNLDWWKLSTGKISTEWSARIVQHIEESALIFRIYRLIKSHWLMYE